MLTPTPTTAATAIPYTNFGEEMSLIAYISFAWMYSGSPGFPRAAEDVRNPLKLVVFVVRVVKRRKAKIVFVAEDILKVCVYSVLSL